MRHAACQPDQLSGFHALGLSAGGEIHFALQALNRHLALHLVRGHGFMRRNHQPHDFELIGLEQGEGAGFGKLLREGMNVNELP